MSRVPESIREGYIDALRSEGVPERNLEAGAEQMWELARTQQNLSLSERLQRVALRYRGTGGGYSSVSTYPSSSSYTTQSSYTSSSRCNDSRPFYTSSTRYEDPRSSYTSSSYRETPSRGRDDDNWINSRNAREMMESFREYGIPSHAVEREALHYHSRRERGEPIQEILTDILSRYSSSISSPSSHTGGGISIYSRRSPPPLSTSRSYERAPISPPTTRARSRSPFRYNPTTEPGWIRSENGQLFLDLVRRYRRIPEYAQEREAAWLRSQFTTAAELDRMTEEVPRLLDEMEARYANRGGTTSQGTGQYDSGPSSSRHSEPVRDQGDCQRLDSWRSRFDEARGVSEYVSTQCGPSSNTKSISELRRQFTRETGIHLDPHPPPSSQPPESPEDIEELRRQFTRETGIQLGPRASGQSSRGGRGEGPPSYDDTVRNTPSSISRNNAPQSGRTTTTAEVNRAAVAAAAMARFTPVPEAERVRAPPPRPVRRAPATTNTTPASSSTQPATQTSSTTRPTPAPPRSNPPSSSSATTRPAPSAPTTRPPWAQPPPKPPSPPPPSLRTAARAAALSRFQVNPPPPAPRPQPARAAPSTPSSTSTPTTRPAPRRPISPQISPRTICPQPQPQPRASNPPTSTPKPTTKPTPPQPKPKTPPPPPRSPSPPPPRSPTPPQPSPRTAARAAALARFAPNPNPTQTNRLPPRQVTPPTPDAEISPRWDFSALRRNLPGANDWEGNRNRKT